PGDVRGTGCQGEGRLSSVEAVQDRDHARCRSRGLRRCVCNWSRARAKTSAVSQAGSRAMGRKGLPKMQRSKHTLRASPICSSVTEKLAASQARATQMAQKEPA